MSEDGDPPNKKLRSSEPDLVVVVGDEEKEYHCHSQVMATHSKVIDAMLATSMRESKTSRINFPDLTAEVWESMIDFLDPLAARQMAIQDALLVAGAYDKYDFCAGARCCDQVFFELFGTLMPDGHNDPKKKIHCTDDLNELIDVFLLADVANLTQTKECAVEYFRGALNSALNGEDTIFSENQIKKLAPLIAKENLLAGSSFTNDEILESLFPKLFIVSGVMFKTNQVVERAVVGLSLSATCFRRVIQFFAQHSCTMFRSTDHVPRGDSSVFLIITRLTNDWVIYTEEVRDSASKTILWTHPLSENMPLPPKSGWVPVDTLATGEPKIRYYYRHNLSVNQLPLQYQ
jgi:hypothetical protein